MSAPVAQQKQCVFVFATAYIKRVSGAAVSAPRAEPLWSSEALDGWGFGAVARFRGQRAKYCHQIVELFRSSIARGPARSSFNRGVKKISANSF
jgi:hypothetical protein